MIVPAKVEKIIFKIFQRNFKFFKILKYKNFYYDFCLGYFNDSLIVLRFKKNKKKYKKN
jgi:hypothetical protein